jgi:YbgC/YbaW family acyl-CoA thioester hydrolase
MAKTYQCRLQVRGYELDSFGHVNNAVYVSYFEEARWRMLADDGITLETFKQWKRFPVIAQLEIQYKRPTYLGEWLEITSRCLEQTKTTFLIEHQIHRTHESSSDRELVTSGKVKVVMVNELGRPADLPEHLALLWNPNA